MRLKQEDHLFKTRPGETLPQKKKKTKKLGKVAHKSQLLGSPRYCDNHLSLGIGKQPGEHKEPQFKKKNNIF
jgi:hypothetical protein